MNESLLWISTGRDRKETSWKNKQVSWPELCQRLSECVYTQETVKEYASYDLQRQGRIKDVGGFVGGVVNGGRRIKGSISCRSLLTLDLDFAPPDFADELDLTTSSAYVLYSTHKHTPEAPRLRLVMPLAREVQADEYEAIIRLFADWIGMNYVDYTSFQAERLMYWPSMPKDGEFYYKLGTGPFLDPDYLLKRYHDWRDISQWPLHPQEKEKVRTDIKVQADPLAKPGVIGAFCRTYGIAEVIEKYLGAEYEPTAQVDRFTYKHGSTSGGLVVYENKFAYSHHSTDPAGQQTCNAFDLVRIHKFGSLDARVRPGTAGNKLPSFGAMSDFAVSDEAVRLLIGREKTAKAFDDFHGLNVSASGSLESGRGESVKEWDVVTEAELAVGDEWLKLLKRDKRGQCLGTIDNVVIILENDLLLKGRIRFNSFTHREIVVGRLPWDKEPRLKTDTRFWTDTDDAGLRHYLEHVYEITGVNKILDGLALVMKRSAFHPVREYLERLVWDGVERLDTMLIDFMGAEDNEFVRMATRIQMTAAVARIFKPGTKYDTALTLIGPQGAAKSELISRLGGEYYSETSGNISTKEGMEQLQGVWLMEMAEMASLTKAEVETVKHFLSKKKDEYRPAYGRRKEVFLRQVTFWPTSNKMDINRDVTGGRRFWPVVVQESTNLVYEALDQPTIDQLWAEAVYRYRGGQQLHLPRHVELIAREIQQEHTEKDPRLPMIEEYLEKLLPEDWDKKNLYERRAFLAGDEIEGVGTIQRTSVSAQEIWFEAMGGVTKDFTTAKGREIHDLMRMISGWKLKKAKARTAYGIVRQYVRE